MNKDYARRIDISGIEVYIALPRMVVDIAETLLEKQRDEMALKNV